MDINALRQKLLTYLPADRMQIIDRAYQYSDSAHKGQSRASGKPYIMHPLTVADILADWRADAPSIVAALLHDVVEDTPITSEQISEAFGGDIAMMVDGLSKIERLQGIHTDVREAESFRKLLLAASIDWRVLFIKLADRLHNMRTLSAISSPEKRRKVAKETLEVYAPIAGRLGILRVQEELQNLSLRYLHPHRFRVLSKAVKKSSTLYRQAVKDIESRIQKGMEKQGIDYTLKRRLKTLYSIYKKMETERLSFAQVEDIVGFRLIVKNKMDCYLTMGVLHELFTPALHRFRDFIAIAKENGYQSLHTGFISKSGVKVDVQIRTPAMDEVAEHGLAAHWLYKQSDGTLDDVQREALRRLSSLVRLHAEGTTPGEFMENIKIDLFPAEMFVLTPEGEIVTLPRGATALDMAYAIHTEVGDHAERAVINGQILPLSMQLNSGDQVKIITNSSTFPLPYWLRHAKTARARSRIRHALHTKSKEEAEEFGKYLLINALQRLGNDLLLEEINQKSWDRVLGANNLKDQKMLYNALGSGEMLPELVARALLKRQVRQEPQTLKPIPIKGAGKSAIHLSTCCHPLPFEPIIGLVRKEKGLIIHSGQCPAVKYANRRSERWTDVCWSEDSNQHAHQAMIRLKGHNQPGLISVISATVSNLGINMVGCHFEGALSEETSLSLEMIVEVKTLEQLELMNASLRRMQEVIHVERKIES